MNSLQEHYFYFLKKKIEQKYFEDYPLCNRSINDWKGQDIANFQSELEQKINGRISEKWFYTHIKPLTNKKLPRIDVLNMLSQYCGYSGWDDFVSSNKLETDVKNEDESKKIKRKRSTGVWVAISLLLVVSLTLVAMSMINGAEKYRFCFVDADFGNPISGVPVEILILNKNESPMAITCDSTGCFEFDTRETTVRFVVKAPYYKTDTIVRTINRDSFSEQFKLKRDDYALMIHLFSTADLNDWEKHRQQMDEMIDEEAEIFQVDNDRYTGMQMYNKWEFIDKLTLPLESLKNIEIIEVKYRNSKIIQLRFV